MTTLIPQKQWCAEEAARAGLTFHAIEKRVELGHYRNLERVFKNKRVVFVRQTAKPIYYIDGNTNKPERIKMHKKENPKEIRITEPGNPRDRFRSQYGVTDLEDWCKLEAERMRRGGRNVKVAWENGLVYIEKVL